MRRDRRMEARVRKLNDEPKMCPGSVSMVCRGVANKTPAEVARIQAPVTNWTELVRSLKKAAQPQATLRQRIEFGWQGDQTTGMTEKRVRQTINTEYIHSYGEKLSDWMIWSL